MELLIILPCTSMRVSEQRLGSVTITVESGLVQMVQQKK